MKKIYFVSDFHLGVNGLHSSREREQKVVAWLDQIKEDADELFLVGDLFDYWFEYKEVVPKGFVRLLGKLGELKDRGISIFFFTGNHDMWMFRYLQDELDIPIYRQTIQRTWNGKTFLIGHGDGLGPGDYGYKFIKAVFANPICQWLFARIHPNLGIGIMRFWSQRSRKATKQEEKTFMGEEKERLLQYANEQLDQQSIDYFVFGHRHLPIDYTLKNGHSRYINLGEWLSQYSYAVFDGQDVTIQFFDNENGKVYSNNNHPDASPPEPHPTE
ncbi:MAG: UDP-2,3-diacylglucosamine diphosphatase [Bacteroidota bacterium]